VLDRVRAVEREHGSKWGESCDPLVHCAPTPGEAAQLLSIRLVNDRAR
jgi:hypothetical protein